MKEPISAKKLRQINLLCVEFADLLDNIPFKNKTDEAKARGFLNSVRKVLRAENIEMAAPKRRVPSFEPEKPRVPVDPAIHKAGLADVRRTLGRGREDGD